MGTYQNDYWQEAVSEALDDVGLKATGDQVKEIASWMEGAHENYGQAMGHDVASRNYHEQQLENTEKLKKELERERDKVPCKMCAGKRAPTFNGEWEDARHQCDYCDRTGKVDIGSRYA